MNARFDLRAEVAGMSEADALAYALDYFDYLFPRQEEGWLLDGVHLEPIESRLLRRLWDSRGAIVPSDHLIGAMYGDRPPDNWQEAHLLPVYMTKVRRRIVAFPVTIVNERGVGYRLDMPRGAVLPWRLAA